MRPFPKFAAFTLLVTGFASASTAQAQGPVLYAPGANTRAYDLSTGAPIASPAVPSRHAPYVTLAPPVQTVGDPRLQHVATWERNLFGREPNARDYAKWADHFRRGGTTEEVLVSMLASDEYWARTGGNFMDWFMASAAVSGRPVTPQQAFEWARVYERNRDRDALLHRFFDVTGVFNEERAATGDPGPALPSDRINYGRPAPRLGYGDASGYYGNTGYGTPGYGYGQSGVYGSGYVTPRVPVLGTGRRASRHDHDD